MVYEGNIGAEALSRYNYRNLKVLSEKGLKDLFKVDTASDSDLCMEAKLGLTDYLTKKGRIAAKETIKDHYDRVQPDDWDKMRLIMEDKRKNMSEQELERLCTPVLPRFYYKCSYCERLFWACVENDADSQQVRLLFFQLKQTWWFHSEIILPYRESNSEEGRKIISWYEAYYNLYGDEEKGIQEDTEFMDYTYPKHEYYDYMLNVVQEFMYSKDAQDKRKSMTDDMIKDYYSLVMYMNYCIDLEIAKKSKIKQECEKDSSQVPDTKQEETKIVHKEGIKQKRKTILVGDIYIHVAPKSITKRSKVITRKCLCWTVRGHVRHYKDGKMVYIRQYKKGRDRNKTHPLGKNYKLIGETALDS